MKAPLRPSVIGQFIPFILLTATLMVVADGFALPGEPPVGRSATPEVSPSSGKVDPAQTCQGPGCPAVSRPVVAVLLPLSGQHSALGQQVRRVVGESLKLIPGVTVRIIDTAGTRAGVRKAFASALTERPVFLAGGVGDSESTELASLAVAAGIPLITMGRASFDGSGVIGTTVSRADLAQATLAAAGADGAIDCAVVVGPDDAFGAAEAAAFKAALESSGIPLVAVMAPRADGGNEGVFAEQVVRAMSEYRSSRRCDNGLLHLVMDVVKARRFVDYLRYAGFFDIKGFRPSMTGTPLFDAPGLVAQSGSSLAGLIFVDVDFDTTFGVGGSDLFNAEVSDFAAVVALAADQASRGVIDEHLLSEGAVVAGKTGRLVFRGQTIKGHRLKVCRLDGRGFECEPFTGTSASPPVEDASPPDAPAHQEQGN